MLFSLHFVLFLPLFSLSFSFLLFSFANAKALDTPSKMAPCCPKETKSPRLSTRANASRLRHAPSRRDNNLYAIDTGTGTLRWKFATGGNVDSSPAVSQDGKTVHVGSDDHNLYAINAGTGTSAGTLPPGAGWNPD